MTEVVAGRRSAEAPADELPAHGASASATGDHSEGMSYLADAPAGGSSPSTCRSRIILVVLLFPFYWMTLTAIKPDEQLLDLDRYSPFWTWNPTFKHIYKLLFETQYPRWLWNTMLVAVGATALSIASSVLAAYAIVRLRFRGASFVGGAIFLAYLVPPSILFIPLSAVVFQYGLFDTPFALILDLSDVPDPVLDLAADGLLQDHPLRARGVRADRRREPLADPDPHRGAARRARPDLGLHLLLTLCWNEFIYALTFLSSTQNKTVPVAIVNEFVDGDIYRWGSLMAGALVGSLPLVILYAFFVEHYVSAMTGAVKE